MVHNLVTVHDIKREEDTIAAIATPMGPGGIGIVRVSGPLSTRLFRSIFRPAKTPKKIQSHRLYYGWVFDPHENTTVDEVLAVLMKAPHSYTREDVLEIQCHSGPAVLRRILEIVIGQDVRLAEPGEFTKRAFLNGRIDLTQAEAVLDLSLARGDVAGQVAIRQLQGQFSFRIKEIHRAIKEAMATLEVAIDYPDEDVEIISGSQLKELLITRARDPLSTLIEAFKRGNIYREGAEVLIIGRPNVGKSSLLNAMSCEDRAIVTAIPGTTRDTIEADIEIEGIVVRLIDTAGIRRDPGPIETIGIKKIREKAGQMQVALWVLDLSRPLSSEDPEVLDVLGNHIKTDKIVIVFNKIDKVSSWEPLARERAREVYKRISEMEGTVWIGISALTGEGLGRLSSLIADKLSNGDLAEPPNIIPNLRQKESLETSLRAVNRAIDGLSHAVSPDLVSIDLRDAMGALGTITGDDITDEVLDHIFSHFCLGK
ncbi:MAG: tRNA uridine-5-carboxymethylaminomethyl(34) synthesis GTPase MnmE [Nitrospiraceae bacterium]|nr:tRNA uridine-5-carboxymethylaminomethyl(34) synthesis GTPase MnmE [Nitrospiraceae bacterium]